MTNKTASNAIECPNCGVKIDVNELLYDQLEEKIHKEYNAKLANKQNKLNEMQRELEAQKKDFDKQINETVSTRLQSERKKIEQQLRESVQKESAEQFQEMQRELGEKSEQLKTFNKAKIEIEKLKREKDELRSAIEAEAQKKINEAIAAEKQKIIHSVNQDMELKLAERNSIIEQLNKQLSEAKRKAEQGSMQLQGEVQEVAIEEWLASAFPLDSIEEIKKGARGADCLHIVNTRSRQNRGSIYYESKRTKEFQPAWVEKFKEDLRVNGADIGVIVTEAMPKDMPRMGLRDGIWICNFAEFKGLCTVLRESVIQVSNAIGAQENKGDKMHMLYGYLTSNEFKLQIEAIVEGFGQMHEDLEREKRAMQSAWKRREKQIEKVLLNTNHMYSSIKGIAGNAVPAIPQLEIDAIDSGIDSSANET